MRSPSGCGRQVQRWSRRPSGRLLNGAVIGVDASAGVIDQHLRVFGYQNMLVCDGAAMPANPGVNPALTITALAEYAMAQIPAVGSESF